jgi:large subunit ribosomal protein L13
MKTRSISQKEIKTNWYLVDVSGVRLGKAASEIAQLLMGKNKVARVDYLKTGDKVVVINAQDIDYYPDKGWRKKYRRHSGYPGGFRELTLDEQMERDATKVIRSAVKGMLPKTKRGREMIASLKIYTGEDYEETAQKPEKVDIK